MSKYFDKDFFRFFVGFMAIIAVSLLIIIVSRVYQNQLAFGDMNVANLIQVITP
ncbi:MAG: hypothetical protein ABL917_01840 [Parcubacteria group bacterium]